MRSRGTRLLETSGDCIAIGDLKGDGVLAYLISEANNRLGWRAISWVSIHAFDGGWKTLGSAQGIRRLWWMGGCFNTWLVIAQGGHIELIAQTVQRYSHSK